MYRKSQTDYDKINEVADDIPAGHKLRDWLSIARILNEHFKTKLSPKQWMTQYESGKRRFKKYGNYAARSTYILKEDKAATKAESLESKSLRLKSYLAKPKTMAQITKFLGIDDNSAMGLIYQLKIQHYLINHDEQNNTYVMDKKPHETPKVYNHSIGKLEEFEFLVVSDSHLCQHGQQLSFINYIYDEAKKRGIKSVYHVGDITDGYYKNRAEQIYDLFAIRIVIDSPLEKEKLDCWNVYSIITDFYHPSPDRLRDWISSPKINGYESLHTTVMGPEGKWVEVQIRSERMDDISEKGYAAHWKYKDAIESPESKLDKWLGQIREVLEAPSDNAIEFIDNFKLYTTIFCEFF